jgi:hypothetical protein
MKTQIIDASQVAIEGKNVLLDTNVWIIINGFCGSAPGPRLTVYSASFRRLLERSNTIVVNDYVLCEFANRCAKFEYELAKGEDPSIPSFKSYRQSSEFAPTMEGVRDTCLNMLDDYEFRPVGRISCDLPKAVTEFCLGKLDLTDLILSQHCVAEDLYLMTDDIDFYGTGVKLITANKKLIKKSGH